MGEAGEHRRSGSGTSIGTLSRSGTLTGSGTLSGSDDFTGSVEIAHTGSGSLSGNLTGSLGFARGGRLRSHSGARRRTWHDGEGTEGEDDERGTTLGFRAVLPQQGLVPPRDLARW